MRNILTLLTIFIFVACIFSSEIAVAKNEVYRWVDENGVVHFGDQPDGNSDAEPVKIDENSNNNITPVTNPPPAPTSEQLEPKPSYAQQQRDEREKRRKEEAEKKEVMTAMCEEQQQLVAGLEPATRVMVEQPDGSVSRMDDNERIERLNAAKTFIAENCN